MNEPRLSFFIRAVKKLKGYVALVAITALTTAPLTASAAWTDNLIFYAPFTDPDNPLAVTVGTGSFTYFRSSSATYVHPTTGLVTVAGQNNLPYSEDMANSAWIASSSSINSNATLSPTGTLTADELIVGAASDGNINHFYQINSTSTGTLIQSNIYTVSSYIKANTNTWIGLALIGKNGTVNICYFNTTTGAIGTCSSNTSGTSTAAANGFYRYSVSASLGTGAATVNARIYLAEADNDRIWTGNSTNSVYVWGTQMNSGAMMAPYVQTDASLNAQARIESGGWLVEGTRTNLLLWSRDMSNAAWTKTNTTAALTQTGMDGVANSATLLTATATDGTVCQAVTVASATSSASVDIKRVSGTGSVAISLNGGSTYTTDLSASLSTTGWYRAMLEDKVIVNPSLCIKLGTNGDSVALDYAQIEVSGTPSAPTGAVFISSRIPTTSTTQTRYIDKLSIPSAGNWNETEGSFFVIGDVWDTATSNKFFVDGTNPARVPLHVRSGQGNGSAGILGRTTIYDGASECSYSSVNVQPQTSTKMATRWSATSGTRGSTASGAAPTNCAFDGAIEVITPMVLGDSHAQDGTRTTWGHMKQFRMYNTAFSDADIQLATAGALTDIGTAPGTPTSLAVATTSTSTVSLSWTAPAVTGGYSITDYTIRLSTATTSTSTWSHSASTNTSATITGLWPNTLYSFTVAAVTAFGTGSTTPISTTTSAIPNPSTPTASPDAGTYTSAQSVTLSSNDSTSIRYATDATPADCSSGTLYSGAITVSSTQTIYTRACNTVSTVAPTASFAYTINIPSSGSSSESTPAVTGGGILWNNNQTPSFPTVVGANTIYDFTINNGATVTTSPEVTVQFGAGAANVSGYLIGLDPAFNNAKASPITPSTTFTLPNTPGTYTVYVRYSTIFGTYSPVISKKIVYDPTGTIKPTLVVPMVTTQTQAQNQQPNIPQPFTFLKTLKLGDEDEGVFHLQRFLNGYSFPIARSGAGSPGNESTYFGQRTKSALIRFQEAYKSQLLTPYGLAKGTGILGPLTRELINKIQVQ
jgi:hypothetical protein